MEDVILRPEGIAAVPAEPAQLFNPLETQFDFFAGGGGIMHYSGVQGT